jgi:cobalt-zinc-cadmium efflux system outer membrane protein
MMILFFSSLWLATAPLPPVLTLAEALSRFRQSGFDLLIAQAQAESAAADVRVAGAVANPQVTGTIGRAIDYHAQCEGCSPWLYGAAVSDQAVLSDLLFGKRQLRVGIARALLGAARLQRDDALRTLTQAVKEAYVQAATAQGSVTISHDALAVTQQMEKVVETRYKAGAVSEADLARAETASLEAEQALDTAEQSSRAAQVSLAFAIGQRGDIGVFSVDDQFLKNDLAAVPEATPLMAHALDKRPDVRAVAQLQRRADIALQQAHRQLVPDLQLQGAYTQQGTGSNALQPPTWSVSLTFALPLFYQFQGEAQKARVDQRQQQVAYDKAHEQVVADVETALSALRSSRSRVARMRSRLLDRAARARDLVLIQYQKGAASLLELLDAQRTLSGVNAEYLQSLNEYWSAVFQLEAASALESAS